VTKPASEHLPSGSHRITINGCDVRYLRAGSGTPVVHVHTLRTQLDMFLQVIERLDTARAEVIAIDLPGHGESAAPPAQDTAGYFSDTVQAPLGQLQLRDTVFAGGSIGACMHGFISLRAQRHPDFRRLLQAAGAHAGQTQQRSRCSPRRHPGPVGVATITIDIEEVTIS